MFVVGANQTVAAVPPVNNHLCFREPTDFFMDEGLRQPCPAGKLSERKFRTRLAHKFREQRTKCV